ncbi:MAG: AAA family ATPase [Candidatus Margulisiibacteriota bacterium]
MSRVQKILEGVAKSDRVGGAYLFLGPSGVGKRETAQAFAEALQCKKQDKFVVAPSGNSLKIDQIRELQGWVRYGPSASRYLVCIVEGADALTDQAAAAFLKTLEEPAPGVVFVLLAEREDRIPATIASRCQKIFFPESRAGWKPERSLNPFYGELKNINKKGVLELLQLSAELGKEKERIEDLLYQLSYFARHELLDTRSARIILDTLRYLKRKANLKLALDVMCLRLGGKNVRQAVR